MGRPRKNPKVTTQSSWDRSKMPRYALAISVVLVDVEPGRGKTFKGEGTLDTVRGEIRYAIERQLKLEVESIRVSMITEIAEEGGGE